MGGSAYNLALTEIELPADNCPDMGQPFHGFRLTLTMAEGGTQTLANDTAIPSSRHCPLGYAISDVLTFYPDGGAPVLAVILSMFTVGFEGPDRRFLAVTAPLPQ
jgi:predicted secreted protein